MPRFRLFIRTMNRWILFLFVLAASFAAPPPCSAQEEPAPPEQQSESPPEPTVDARKLPKITDTVPRSIVLVLANAFRHDILGIAGHPWIETQHLDSLAREGVYCRNAFTTNGDENTSRIALLTGVDNATAENPIHLSEYLKHNGDFATAFIGKWLGAVAGPPTGYDYRVILDGPGSYPPWNTSITAGEKTFKQRAHLTDELTDYAIRWLKGQTAKRQFFLILSHKALEMPVPPADRHAGRYNLRAQPVSPAASQKSDPHTLMPRWVQDQRDSSLGVEFPFGSATTVQQHYKNYCESVLALDDSIGRIVQLLREKELLDSTLIVVAGVNGCLFGEHGLIGHRSAYEEAFRIPMLLRCPEMFQANTKIDALLANIDVVPTLLEASGFVPPRNMPGRSFLAFAKGDRIDWRQSLVFHYHWNPVYPQTPTHFALRSNRFKYILPYGIWDLEELYDLESDPHEINSLVVHPNHAKTLQSMRQDLAAHLRNLEPRPFPVQLDAPTNAGAGQRKSNGAALFPSHWVAPKKAGDSNR